MTRREQSLTDQFRQQITAAKYVNPYRAFGWFLALALPWAIAMSAFIGWHNSVVGEVQPWHLVLRLAIGIVSGLPIILVVFVKAILPALRQAQREEQDTGSC